MKMHKQDRNLKVTLVAKPFSTDPLDYDYSVHHNTMRSIYASLVSNYKKDEIVPQIAKSWESNQDHSIWKLTIDPNWTFKNGKQITPNEVILSLKRVLYLKNKLDSKSGLLEFLIESEKMLTPQADIAGLTIENNKVVFKFVKSMPHFLEKISFGLYSIVDHEDFNNDGTWKNKKSINSSGKYYISKWDDTKFEIELRKEYRSSDKYIENVQFIFPEDLSEIENSSMVFSDRLSNKLNSDEWYFNSSYLDNKIIYIQVMKWARKNSIFSDVNVRRNLRDIFYQELEKAGMKPIRTFFPLSLKGIKEFQSYSNVKKNIIKLDELTTQPFGVTDYKKLKIKKSQADIFYEAMEGVASNINASLKINNYPQNSEDEVNLFDLQFLGTGISIDEPSEDIKFMFKSKHGIMLPDENKEIDKLLNGEVLDYVRINELLWNQAIVWPVKHYSTGFWIKKDSGVDLENLNNVLTPIDFQFIKWKN